MPNIHYYNGKWVKDKDLTVSVFDLSVLRGFGVFDFFRTWNRKLLSLADNIARFYKSAKVLGLKVPISPSELEKVIHQGLKKNSVGDINVRLILTGGVSVDHITPGPPSLIILFSKSSLLPEHYYKKGVKVITQPTPRSFAEAKSLNYLAAVRAIQETRKVGGVEAIYVDPLTTRRRRLYEGTTSNFFAVTGNKLVTPNSDVLYGITRKIVIELAHELSISVVERDVFASEISKFSEAFLTASNKGVLPVVRIDKHVIGNGKPGPITARLEAAFREFTAS